MATLNQLRGGDAILYPNPFPGGTVSSINTVQPTVTLVGGTGISVAAAGNTITVTNSESGISMNLAQAGGVEDVAATAGGPAMETKGLTAGTGINLTGGANEVTITNSSLASALAINTGGSGTSIINDGTGPTCQLMSLAAGSGFSVALSTGSDFGDQLTISATPASKAYLHAEGGNKTIVDTDSAYVTCPDGVSYAANGFGLINLPTGGQVRNESGRTITCKVTWKCGLDSATNSNIIYVLRNVTDVTTFGTHTAPTKSAVNRWTSPSGNWIITLADADVMDVYLTNNSGGTVTLNATNLVVTEL